MQLLDRRASSGPRISGMTTSLTENVDRAGMMAGEFESVQGALRLPNLMAGRAQIFRDGQAQRDFIIDVGHLEAKKGRRG